MNPVNHISKLGATALLAVIVYMHVCSVWCDFGGGCSKNLMQEKREHSKSCCNTNNNKSSSNDCQEEHLAFFANTGQYFVGFNSDVTNTFPLFQTTIGPEVIVFWSEGHETLAEYNSFHPPPPKAGIRTLIQSFQI